MIKNGSLPVSEFDDVPHKDYRSFINWLARKKKSYEHQIEVLKAPGKVPSKEKLAQVKSLRDKIKEIERDYQGLTIVVDSCKYSYE